MKRQSKSSTWAGTEFLFSVLLFLVFLLCSVFTILIGSRVYENIRAQNDRSFQTDTVLAYITNRVRQADRLDAVDLRELEGQQMLVLTSEVNDTIYETWIYTLDGALWELFAEKDIGLGLEDGQEVMACPPLTFTLESTDTGDQLLSAEMPDDVAAHILLRSSRREESQP